MTMQRSRRARSIVACVVTFVVVFPACAAKRRVDPVTPPASPSCPAGRGMLDGACAVEEVADYVACVRAQAAKLERTPGTKSLGSDASEAARGATSAVQVLEKLERQRTESDESIRSILRACADFRKPPGKIAACIEGGKLGVGCGFEPDPRWGSRCDVGPVVSCLFNIGPTCEGVAQCAVEGATRTSCGEPLAPSGTVGCMATLDCYRACRGEKACECGCTSAMAPASVVAVAMVAQCYEVKCAGCGAKARGDCAMCFRTSCQKKLDELCKGH
jgi:hypothetical protein